MQPQELDIEFQPIGKRVKVAVGASLYEAAREAGIDLASACGGEGSCGQCQVVLLSGEVTPATSDEEFILTEPERLSGLRLACCTHALSDVRVEIPKGSLVTGQRLQVAGNLRAIQVDPLVTAYPLELSKPTLHDIRSDLTRLLDGLGAQHGLNGLSAGVQVMRAAPAVLRESGWRVTAYVRGAEVVGLGPPDERPLGFAVDLGTTKIAAYLVDLASGEDLAATGAPNPQIGYGEDVISRLNYVHRDPNGRQVLSGKVHSLLNELLGELVRQVGARREQVVEACIVGNTAMTHLLLELPVHQLVTAPYIAAASSAVDIRAAALDLAMAPGAYVHIPPCIGGFVGADHVAMLLACDLDQADEITLGVDIGTNTEIAIRVPGRPFVTSASCASGPAFEGAHIGDGMRAATGAIEKVRIDSDALEFVTIDDAPAVGLCGSGIVDTIAELYRVGLINRQGRFQRDLPRLRAGRRGPEFVLVPAADSGTGRDIIIDQEDVNQIQLAKGAIQAGLNILLETTGTRREQVQDVIIAGAFGSYLNVENAIAMGLFPELPNARYRQVGNAAVVGAKWILLSKAARQRAQEIAAGTSYNELTIYPKFSRQFAIGMLFPDR